MRLPGGPAFDQFRRAAAGVAAGGRPPLQLVRDFIHDSLYHPAEGYFCRTSGAAAVVGSPPAPLPFGQLAGRADYLAAVRDLYAALAVQWLTPVELFQPHFGAAVARCVWERHVAQGRAQRGEPLQICELGGGTGTLARDVLDWLRHHQPQGYASAQYTCVEISPRLAQLQRAKVAGAPAQAPGAPAAASGGHAGRFAVRCHDAADAAAWERQDAAEEKALAGGCGGTGDAGLGSGPPRAGGQLACRPLAQQHCYVLACEVLDNLPHDRAWRQRPGAPWQQTMVAPAPATAPADGGREGARGWPGWGVAGSRGRPKEVLEPATDPLILRCLEALEMADAYADAGADGGGLGGRLAGALRRALAGAAGEVVWLPTGCLRLLDTLHRVRPSHTLIAADFDTLPEVQLEGRNAPLVATTTGGATIDHPTYLVPRGAADVFFPTDFHLLRQLYLDSSREAEAREAEVVARARRAGGPAERGGARRWEATAESVRTRAFMEAHAQVQGTATLSGYNPLLEDYSNTAFFLASRLPVGHA